MRRTFILPLVLLVTSALSAADQGPADLILVGPDTAAVGESVRLRLDGLPEVDLSKTMSEQLSWMGKVRIITAAPRGVTESDYTLDQQLSIRVGPFQWTFSLDFVARKPGDYVVLCDWNEEPYGLALHRITVGGGKPQPPDNPDPPVPPPPLTATGALILFEDDTLTPSQAVTINTARNSPTMRKKVQMLDKDSRGTDEQPLPQVVKALAHIGNKPLPVVVPLGADGSFGDPVELPPSSQALIELLTSWGVVP